MFLAETGISEREGTKVKNIKLQLIITFGRTGSLQSAVALRRTVEQVDTNRKLVASAIVKKKVVRHGVEESKASLCAHTQQFVGLCVQRCYVEDSRSMWLHPTPSHRGLWRAAILVKPTSVSAGGFNTAPFPSPRCGSSLLKLPEKSHFTTFERRSHVGECSCCRCCRRKITIMQHM